MKYLKTYKLFENIKTEEDDSERKLTTAINGAIKSAIIDHGNINRELIGSVSKRIMGQIKGTLISDYKNMMMKKIDKEHIVIDKNKYLEMEEQINKKNKCIKDLIDKINKKI